MKKTSLFPILMIIPLISACGETTYTQNPPPFSDCLIEDGDAIVPSTGDSYDIEDGAQIKGDTLHVTVGYGGGCEAHEFSICWPDASFLESDPVQANLTLFHNANGDSCEAYLSEEIELDLTPLRLAYEDSYGTSEGTIVINFDEEQIPYTF